jgi:hypothetical protein
MFVWRKKIRCRRDCITSQIIGTKITRSLWLFGIVPLYYSVEIDGVWR